MTGNIAVMSRCNRPYNNTCHGYIYKLRVILIVRGKS